VTSELPAGGELYLPRTICLTYGCAGRDVHVDIGLIEIRVIQEIGHVAADLQAIPLRLLQTLLATGYLHQDESGEYLVNGNWVRAGEHDWIEILVNAARPKMEWLNLELAETVSLAALMGDHIRVVETIESPRQIRMSNYRNRIIAPYASSLGKAIAAYQTPEKVHELLQVYGLYGTTGRTLTDPSLIRREMEKTRDRGYSTEYEETVRGGCCMGAPIFVSGGVSAAISVSLPADRLTPELEQRLPGLLCGAAQEISAACSKSKTLGHQ
jgi:DNA-binding IclR family transcriptional regulator